MPRIGISLSGGGARGIAHLGVLKALEEQALRPNLIAGTSAGAIFGALYAAGMSPDDIVELVIDTPIRRYFKPSISLKGLINARGLHAELARHIKEDNFASLNIPMVINATDLYTGNTVFWNSGPLIKRIVASSSMPFVFEPTREGDHCYVDGGVLNNMPLEPLIQENCEYKIGVHVNPFPIRSETLNMRKSLEKTLILVIQNTIRQNIPYFDLFIEPTKLSDYNVFEVKKFRQMYEIGYEEACRVLEVEELAKKMKREG